MPLKVVGNSLMSVMLVRPDRFMVATSVVDFKPVGISAQLL